MMQTHVIQIPTGTDDVNFTDDITLKVIVQFWILVQIQTNTYSNESYVKWNILHGLASTTSGTSNFTSGGTAIASGGNYNV